MGVIGDILWHKEVKISLLIIFTGYFDVTVQETSIINIHSIILYFRRENGVRVLVLKVPILLYLVTGVMQICTLCFMVACSHMPMKKIL